MKTISVHLRANLTSTGRFITTVPRSVLSSYAERFALKQLPVDLPEDSWPIKIATLKDRTLSPIVERFIDCAHDVAKSLGRSILPPQAIRNPINEPQSLAK
jgi:DNA-binding transcriptional LysR family regulator